MRKIFLAAAMMMFLQLTVKADAASIFVVPGGNGVYYVRGVDFNEIGGVEVEIQYDTATLSNPRITQGAMLASTMFIPNTKFSASSVKIAAMSLSAIKGSGDLAVLNFDLKGGAPGSVSIIRSKLAAATGTAVKHDTPTAPVNTPNDPGATQAGYTPTTGQSSGSATAGAASGGVSGGVSGSPSIGTITLPQDQLASTDKKTEYQPLVTDLRKDMTIPLGGAEAGQSSVGKQKDNKGKEEEKKFVSYKSVQQFFKEFKGEKTPKDLIAIFADAQIPGFTQEPPIAFTDGKTPLRLTLVLKQSGSEAPKFIMQGANIKQLSEEGEELITWNIDAIPRKDAAEATLTIIDGQIIMEIPLTVTAKIDPLLTKGKALSEADFALYLSKPAKFDLNKDEKFDAQDDFIYTANYISAMKIKPEKLRKEEKKEQSKPEVKSEKTTEPAKAKDEKGKSADKPTLKP